MALHIDPVMLAYSLLPGSTIRHEGAIWTVEDVDHMRGHRGIVTIRLGGRVEQHSADMPVHPVYQADEKASDDFVLRREMADAPEGVHPETWKRTLLGAIEHKRSRVGEHVLISTVATHLRAWLRIYEEQRTRVREGR